MLRTIPVHAEQLQLLALAVEPKTDFDTKVQKTDRDGLPVWTVMAYSVAYADALKVAVAAPTAPELRPGQLVDFIGLRAGVYATGDRANFYWTAEAVA